jgi:hypothetical protein
MDFYYIFIPSGYDVAGGPAVFFCRSLFGERFGLNDCSYSPCLILISHCLLKRAFLS